MELLTLKEEWELSEVICSLHPHKQKLKDVKPKFYVIRPGWGNFLLKCNKNKEAKDGKEK